MQGKVSKCSNTSSRQGLRDARAREELAGKQARVLLPERQALAIAKVYAASQKPDDVQLSPHVRI